MGNKRKLQTTTDGAITAKRRKSDGISEKPKYDKSKDGYKSKDGSKSKDKYNPKDRGKQKDGEKKPHIVPQLLDCMFIVVCCRFILQL